MQRTYCEIKGQSKDIHVILTYAPDCSVSFTYCFNSISGGYMGLQLNSFIDSVRGLLKIYPSFFEDLSEHDYRKYFESLGIFNTEPTEMETRLYSKL